MDGWLGTGRAAEGSETSSCAGMPKAGQDLAANTHPGTSALHCRPYVPPSQGSVAEHCAMWGVGGAVSVHLPPFPSFLPWVGGSATVFRSCCNGSLYSQDRSCWTHWRRPGISSSVMCCQPCRPSSTLCRCVLAGCVGVRGLWGHRMTLVGSRTPALTTPSVLTQAVSYRPA